RDELGQTALFSAVGQKKFSVAKKLLDLNADPNIATNEGRTPLMAVIKRGYSASYNKRDDESREMIKILLDKGANVNATDADGTTPLMEAASVGDHETIKALLSRGADATPKKADGKDALDLAAYELRGRAVKAMIEAGVPLTTKQKIYYYSYRFARLEGWVLPFVIVLSFLVGYFGKKLTKPLPKRNAVDKGDDLPHLVPLKCDTCGAGVPLKVEKMKCLRCDTAIPVPEDYAKTNALREKAAIKLQRAVAAWRRANLFTAWPIRWTLWLVAPFILIATLIGCFTNIGNSLFAISTSVAFLAMFALLGGISLVIAFWAYAFYLNGTRKRLPQIPNVGEKVGAAEVASCHLCGGGIKYEEGDLAALCGYCGGETYRVAVARSARLKAAEEKEQAAVSLYDAMSEIVARRQQAFKSLMYASAVIFGLAFSLLILLV
ncbi:MAG: ankyrin repeat domain-containing protein, partial [Pyrinomonadaceae bacterium]|nr:ankyrin repeat domain-containing protein [Pyrinomonadaceae bacterium]